MLTKKEQAILDSILIRSDNNPRKPEFPPENPKFPATPTTKIKIPGFRNVWLKDESHNPTGTHKDRMAWEMIVTYRDFLLAKKLGHVAELPHMSIITSGTAGYTIQKYLNRYGLPHLKCLVDSRMEGPIIELMESVGCEIFETDLSKKAFTWQEILKLTNNVDGIDITSSEALDPTTRFYDWLSYEIINTSPDYCFIPFGTGNLYENILNICKKEIRSVQHDPRFRGDIKKLRNCHFMGATTNNPKSKAEKLYSPHLPFVHFGEQWIRFYRYAAYCGNQSGVSILKEKFLDEAIDLAARLGIEAEPSGLAGMGMLLQMKQDINNNAKILVVSTGRTKYDSED